MCVLPEPGLSYLHRDPVGHALLLRDDVEGLLAQVDPAHLVEAAGKSVIPHRALQIHAVKHHYAMTVIERLEISADDKVLQEVATAAVDSGGFACFHSVG